MVRLNWTIQAVNDLKDIADYISKDSKRYASLLVKRIQAKVKLLKINQIVVGWLVNWKEKMLGSFWREIIELFTGKLILRK